VVGGERARSPKRPWRVREWAEQTEHWAGHAAGPCAGVLPGHGGGGLELMGVPIGHQARASVKRVRAAHQGDGQTRRVRYERSEAVCSHPSQTMPSGDGAREHRQPTASDNPDIHMLASSALSIPFPTVRLSPLPGRVRPSGASLRDRRMLARSTPSQDRRITLHHTRESIVSSDGSS
jgi:hypothetical protein